MPGREEVSYFGAGPAALPTTVLEEASHALLNYNSTGVGLLEMSHRSKMASDILADTSTKLRTLLDVTADYEILFMQGGGTGEFSAIVYNMVNIWVQRRKQRIEQEMEEQHGKPLSTTERSAAVFEQLRNEVREELILDYLVTGSWSLKASQEAARLLGAEHVNIALDAREVNNGRFIDIPDEGTWKLTPSRKRRGPGAALVYYCDNETVDGVEFPAFPRVLQHADPGSMDAPLVVADMSSNLLSRKVDVKRFAIIFVGG